MSRIQNNPFTFSTPPLTTGGTQKAPTQYPPGTRIGPRPAPPRDVVRDVFESVVSGEAMRRLQGLGKMVTLAQQGPFPQRQPRGGAAPLTDATGVGDVVFKQRDNAREPGDGPVTRLQKFLERAGYLDRGGADYGYFGPLTQEALEDFQTAEGISPADGKMSPATLTAMQRPQHPAIEPTMGLLAETYAPQLGRPMSPLEPGRDGARVQQFERGSITRMPGGEVRVQDLSGKDIVPPTPPSTVKTLEEAKALHVAQNSKPGLRDYNDGSEYYGGNDCGPTSVVITATAVGAMEHPDAAGAGEAIDAVRDNILDVDSIESVTMIVTAVAEGVTEAGAVATTLLPGDVDVEAVDAALSRGHPVILGGNPFIGDAEHPSWGKTAYEAGNYFSSEDFGYHWAAVTGKTEEGNYIVNDPLCPKGPIEVTPEQMAQYVSDSCGMVEVSPKPVPVS
ncbi:peptidoglycan-binding protein [Corallococcus sp. AS-1-6]|uniref:peptidoglycan-binding protein n=1 Tax=Corallococcus sp. AS-1-6 TaxID=2874599 RepID=UPI001CBFEEC2|nr:peptidoglycan-binding protein [Corallococcus sp. AS-1-6]MBZ4373186.1 peptidoglycan-binding protein [Corallococcus sp. AS-1-6]